jgi:hemoglobin
MEAVMKRRALSLVVLLSCCGWALGQAKPASEAPSLYKRLGGYDAIAAVTDDFFVRAMADAQLNRFLIGLSETSKGRLRQLIVDKICADTGAPASIPGGT